MVRVRIEAAPGEAGSNIDKLSAKSVRDLIAWISLLKIIADPAVRPGTRAYAATRHQRALVMRRLPSREQRAARRSA